MQNCLSRKCNRRCRLQNVGKFSLQWRPNGRDNFSNHQPHDCLLNRLFRRRSKKTSKLRVTGLCVGKSPRTVEFPAQMASNAENVSISWRHHVVPVRVNPSTLQKWWKLNVNWYKLSGLNAIAINTSFMKTYISIYFASIMTSSNGIIFHVNVPLWGESTGHWWIPLTEGRWRGLLMLLLLLIWINCWACTRRLTDNSRSDGSHLTSL